MRRAGLLLSQRGADGGYRLSRPATAITVADVIRPLDGPLAEVRGLRPEAANYEGAAEHLQDVWIAVRSSLRSVLEQVTIADIVSGQLPTAGPEAHHRPRRLALALNAPGLTPARVAGALGPPGRGPRPRSAAGSAAGTSERAAGAGSVGTTAATAGG